MEFKENTSVTLNNKTYKIVGTIKRSWLLERDGKQYRATTAMMNKIKQQNQNGIGNGRRRKRTIDHMARRLAYRRIFDKTAKLPVTEKEHMNWFAQISCDLSPENLHCDGEISNAAAMRKASGLRAEWKQLEKSLGRKVSEEEAW